MIIGGGMVRPGINPVPGFDFPRLYRGMNMPRKPKGQSKLTSKEFTRNIHSSIRAGTKFANMSNHDERKAKAENKLCCHDCRFYNSGCNQYIGMYHKTCSEFRWW